MDNLIKIAQDAMWTKKEVPSFKSGDTITVSYRIVEGNKERIQSFRGVVIQIKGRGSIQRRRRGAYLPALLPAHRQHRSEQGGRRSPFEDLLSARPDGQEGPHQGETLRRRRKERRITTDRRYGGGTCIQVPPFCFRQAAQRRARACRPLRQTPRHRTRHRFPRRVPGRLPLLRSCRPTPACGFRWAPVDSTESRCERRPGCRPTPACGFRRIYFYICITREPNPQML